MGVYDAQMLFAHLKAAEVEQVSARLALRIVELQDVALRASDYNDYNLDANPLAA